MHELAWVKLGYNIEKHIIPRIEKLLDRLQGDSKYSKIDLKS